MSNLILGHVSPLTSLRTDVFGRLESEVDRFFNEMLNPKSAQRARGDHYPKTDIVRKGETDLEFRMALPFVKKEDVNIELCDGYLTVSGKSEEVSEAKADYLLKELRKSAFCRSFYVGDTVKTDSISAELKEGVLFITLKGALAEKVPKRQLISIG